MSYLGRNGRYITNRKEAIRDALDFTFSIVPKDIPLNEEYGITIPSTVDVNEFCIEYKNNANKALSALGYGVTVEDVTISGKLLKVKVKYSQDESETWELTI